MMENVFQEEVGQMIRDMRANYCEEIRRVEFQLEKSEAECDKLTDAMDRQGFPRFKGQSREQFIEQVGVESGTGSNTVNILCALNTVRGRIYNLAFISPTTLRESALKIIDEVKAESGTGSNTVNILCALNTVRGRIYNLASISPTTLRESALKIIDEVKAETELTFR